MPKQPASKDLFGKPVKQRRPRYEATVERADKTTRPDRAARTRWLAKAIPKGYGFGLPLETVYVLNDAISSFIAGNFVAVIVLSSAFVEHWFTACLSERGYEKEASRGLAASIKLASTHDLVQPAILSKVDRLRLIRNPFVHLKAYGASF